MTSVIYSKLAVLCAHAAGKVLILGLDFYLTDKRSLTEKFSRSKVGAASSRKVRQPILGTNRTQII